MKHKLNWDKANGLIPTIIQDSYTLQVLMLGYMNKEALQKTHETGKVTFYSRTKQRLWVKGETSGNSLEVIDILADCDGDTLLVMAKPNGPTCHLGTQSCFGEKNISKLSTLTQLETLITQRYQERPTNSYVTKLFDEGSHRIAQKVGEEGVEVALACLLGIKENTIKEGADLLFHLLVLLRQCRIDLVEVLAELQDRTK
ncbi:putative bifunctional phosphoribosyl-AMP cyclohydrolase/phosphoribosyl-ATP pyrophosphatase [Gammaproteobacteria bacterium]